MLPNSRQARELVRLGQVMEERPKRADDQRKPLAKIEGAHVARHDGHTRLDLRRPSSQFGLEGLKHGPVGVQCMNWDACGRDSQRDTASAGPEFKDWSPRSLCLAGIPLMSPWCAEGVTTS